MRDGGLCFLEEFEKALDEIQLDTDHPAAGSGQAADGLKYSSKVLSGGTRRAAPRPGLLPHRQGPRSSPSSSTGQVRIRVAQCMQAEAPAHVTHPTRQAASAGGAPSSAGAAKRKASTSRSSSLSG